MNFIPVQIRRMPLEDVREALATLCEHLGVSLEVSRSQMGDTYRVVPADVFDIPEPGSWLMTYPDTDRQFHGQFYGWEPGTNGDVWHILQDDGKIEKVIRSSVRPCNELERDKHDLIDIR